MDYKRIELPPLPPQELLALSEREKECYKLVQEGFSNKEIAYRLALLERKINTSTVSKIKARILTKLFNKTI